MQLKTKTLKSATIITLSGRIDTMNAVDLQAALTALLHETASAPEYIFEMNEVIYLSSAGMRAFLIIMKEVEARQGKMLFVGFVPLVQDVIHMAGLVKYFPHFLTLEAALLALRK